MPSTRRAGGARVLAKIQKSPPIVATGTRPCTKISSSSTKRPNGATPVMMPVNLFADFVAHEDDFLPLQHFALGFVGAALALARLRGVRADARASISASRSPYSGPIRDQLAEAAMHDEIGIAADRRSEVAVVLDAPARSARGSPRSKTRASSSAGRCSVRKRSSGVPFDGLQHALQLAGTDVFRIAAQRAA